VTALHFRACEVEARGSTLRYIEELKKKHGIDYDSHGSYRFVEE
jgi:hypothetical protein